jgi:hypothetical protein
MLERIPVQSEELARTYGMPLGTADGDFLVAGGPRSLHPPPQAEGEGAGAQTRFRAAKKQS